jgi:hypothetical protein
LSLAGVAQFSREGIEVPLLFIVAGLLPERVALRRGRRFGASFKRSDASHPPHPLL